MSFVAVAASVVGEGLGATLLGGAMMGASFTGVNNIIHGRNPFDNIAQGALLGGATAGIAPEVGAELGVTAPTAAGITAGGLTAIQTKGDLGKSIMAGMSAYGLAGLSQNMQKVGETSLDANTAANAQTARNSVTDATTAYNAEAPAVSTPDTMGAGPNKYGADYGVDIPSANVQTQPSGYSDSAIKSMQEQAAQEVTDNAPQSTAGERALAGRQSIADTGVGKFLKNNATNLMYAAGPILTDTGNTPKLPPAAANNSMIRRFSYDPYSGTYTPQGSYKASLDKGMASGGIARLANGGAVAFADGGTPPAPADTSTMSVADLYQNILGRAPDAGGLAYWQQQFGNTVDPAELATFKGAAQAELANRTPAEQQQLAPNLVGGIAQQPPIVQTAQTPPPAGITALGATQAAPVIEAAAPAQAATTPAGISAADAQAQVANMYRNVLGRDADPQGLAYWTNQITSGVAPERVYNDFLTSARGYTELVTADQIKNKDFAAATTPYTGYQSSDQSNIVDEWVRNTLGREPTAADKAQTWYKDAFNKMGTASEATNLYGQFQDYAKSDVANTTAQKIKDATASLAARGLTEADVVRQTGKTIAQLAASDVDFSKNLVGASQLLAPGTKAGFDFDSIKKAAALTNPQTNAPAGTTNPYGNTTNPGDQTRNADGSITVQPNIPGRPYGGFSGMGQVKDAYTAGGGSLGYTPYAPKTAAEQDAMYNTMTGGSKQAYDYLTGKSTYSATPYTPTGEVMKPYSEATLGMPVNTATKQYIFDPATKKYTQNPDYVPVSYTSNGEKVSGLSSRDIYSQLPNMAAGDYAKWMTDNNVTLSQIAQAMGISLAEATKRYGGSTATATAPATNTTAPDVSAAANGGLMAMAGGGMAAQYDLGGYSDGGRLLRGPGDGVSDSIPATIGNKRPARLADGEFVVPARIVSELGNGSTEAGARQLYAMMDRVQKARKGSIGKGNVAKNSRADKHLPA